jgi:hypothetical protein
MRNGKAMVPPLPILCQADLASDARQLTDGSTLALNHRENCRKEGMIPDMLDYSVIYIDATLDVALPSI